MPDPMQLGLFGGRPRSPRKTTTVREHKRTLPAGQSPRPKPDHAQAARDWIAANPQTWKEWRIEAEYDALSGHPTGAKRVTETIRYRHRVHIPNAITSHLARIARDEHIPELATAWRWAKIKGER